MQELLERKKGLHRSILIVDDDYIAREILGTMLKDMYEVCYAENGAVALDIIRRDKLKLSLVILDLHMPEMDGYSLLKLLRADNELCILQERQALGRLVKKTAVKAVPAGGSANGGSVVFRQLRKNDHQMLFHGFPISFPAFLKGRFRPVSGDGPGTCSSGFRDRSRRKLLSRTRARKGRPLPSDGNSGP